MQDFQSATPVQGATDQDKSRRRSVIQREIVMQEADYRRSINEKIKLEAEVRQLKNDEAHIRVSLQEKQAQLTHLEQEVARADSELRELKKKLNTL
jgi:septal ring factor EnvC (AmiA/AmiB activator)